MDIHRIPVEGPPQVGDTNTYFIPGRKNTLIDTGPRSDKGIKQLEEGLENIGYGIEDLDQVIITHPHSDHFGNASKIKELSGAEVMIHEDAVWIVEDYEGYIEDQNSRFKEYFRKHGVPEEKNENLVKLCIPNFEKTSVEIDHALADGDEVKVGANSIECISTPGHCPSSMVFRAGSKIFAGDTILEKTTPNPMLYMPENSDDVPRTLVQYIESLEKLRTLDIDEVFTGHGKNVESPGKRIGEILEHHEERKKHIFKLLDGQKTAFKVMQEMFSGLGRDKWIFGLSESIGHLELLEEEGRVEKIRDDDTINYARR